MDKKLLLQYVLRLQEARIYAWLHGQMVCAHGLWKREFPILIQLGESIADWA